MSKQCAVYILVEPDQFKIGHSVSVAGRAKLVTPNVIWEKSSALYFDTVREAISCENAIHFLFRSSRLAPQPRDGGTEFFSLDCLPLVEKFIDDHKETFGFHQIKRGRELVPSIAPKHQVSTIQDGKKAKISLEEKARTLRIENENNAQEVFAILKNLKDKGILQGLFFTQDYVDPNSCVTHLALISRDGKLQDELFRLHTHGQFSDRNFGVRLFGAAWSINNLAGNHLGVIDLNISEKASRLARGQDEFITCFSEVFDLINSLPVLSKEIVDIIRSVFPRASFNSDKYKFEQRMVDKLLLQSIPRNDTHSILSQPTHK